MVSEILISTASERREAETCCAVDVEYYRKKNASVQDSVFLLLPPVYCRISENYSTFASFCCFLNWKCEYDAFLFRFIQFLCSLEIVQNKDLIQILQYTDNLQV